MEQSIYKSKQWINYPIFISSTFRDMDYERDTIKFRVIPRLNEHYRKHHIQFQAVDLRVGINTEEVREEEREDYILDVCLGKIAESRPFFVALLGERYGWIPSEKRWEEVIERLGNEERPLLDGSKGGSVTEMEILYGAIGNDGKYINHSIFMMRSPKSYAGMTTEAKAAFCDTETPNSITCLDQTKSQRLTKLKQRIISIANEKHIEDCLCQYSLQWDSLKECFADMLPFEDMLFEKLCNEIDKEIESLPIDLQTWQTQESDDAEAMVTKLSGNAVRTSLYEDAVQDLAKGAPFQWLICGKGGAGKSVLAAQLCQYLLEDGWTGCLAWIGSGTYSYEMRPIITRWIQQLSGRSEGEYDTDRLIDKSATSDVELFNMLSACKDEAERTGKRVFFFADGVEQTSHFHENDIYQMWVRSNMNVILTVDNDSAEKVMTHHGGMRTIDMASLNIADKQLIIKAMERYYNLGLPQGILQHMLSADITPLRTRLLMMLFSQLSVEDHKAIRNSSAGNDIQSINSYLEKLFVEAPEEEGELARHVIQTFINRMHLPASYMRLFQWMAASEIGLRESDMERLMGKEWDQLHYLAITYMLDDLLTTNIFSRQWCIHNQSLKQALMADNDKEVYKELATALLQIQDDDPLKRNLLIYALIHAGSYELGKDYLGTDLKYLGDEDLKSWLKVSTNLLLTKPNRLSMLQSMTEQMSPTIATMFVCRLITHGINDMAKYHESDEWALHLLYNIPANELDRNAAYQLAMQFMRLQQTSGFGDSNTKAQRKDYLGKAIEALKHCYELDPDNRNTRHMYSVALMEKSDLAMEEGDFEQFEQLMQAAASI